MLALQEWKGPLPPPAILEQFDAVVPGSAARVVEEFQAEAHHRRAMEAAQTRQIGRETLLGQMLAITFGSGGLATVAYAISQDSPWVAGVLGGGLIVSGMVALIKGRRN